MNLSWSEIMNWEKFGVNTIAIEELNRNASIVRPTQSGSLIVRVHITYYSCKFKKYCYKSYALRINKSVGIANIYLHNDHWCFWCNERCWRDRINIEFHEFHRDNWWLGKDVSIYKLWNTLHLLELMRVYTQVLSI